MHASPIARDFCLEMISTLRIHSNAPFPKRPPPSFFSVLTMAKTGSCVGPHNKIGHPARCFIQTVPRSEELRTQKLKSHLVRTESLNVLPLKPEVGQYIAIHTTLLPGISSFLISTLPVHSPAFFPKPLPIFFPVLAVADTGTCVGPQNKKGHPAGCRFPC